jgi:hypothetical protein
MPTTIAAHFDHDLVVDRTCIGRCGYCRRARSLHAWRGAIRGIGGDLAIVEIGPAFLFVCRAFGDDRFRCIWPVEVDEPDLPSEARAAMRARRRSQNGRPRGSAGNDPTQ